MRRVIGMDIRRTFAEVVVWQAGELLPAGRVDMTRAGLEGFGRMLDKVDEVVVEATGNAMAVVRALEQHVARVIIAIPATTYSLAAFKAGGKCVGSIVASACSVSSRRPITSRRAGPQDSAHARHLCARRTLRASPALYRAPSPANPGRARRARFRPRQRHTSRGPRPLSD